MNNTPIGNRKHISIFGRTNSGKSSLINKLTNQDISIVSSKIGTTTDPVTKAMELLPFGPVLFTDTAGICDNTELGEARTKKTMEILKRSDIAIYLVSSNEYSVEEIEAFKNEGKKYNLPFILVFNKIDLINKDEIERVQEKYEDAILVSTRLNKGLELLKDRILKVLSEEEEDSPLIGDLLPYGSNVIMVVPIDSEAPKGRLILPQVQCIRDALDYGIKVHVLRDSELEEGIKEIKNIDLVITDSQVFKKVNEIVPNNINLTSFSMLFARQKGNIREFIKGSKEIGNLKVNDKVLITETCTHNTSHEDIGRIKIPNMLKKYVGGELDFTFTVGRDFPDNIKEYKLVIHCGGCMVTRKTMINRINVCKENHIPITNYGVALSFLTNTLERTSALFLEKPL